MNANVNFIIINQISELENAWNIELNKEKLIGSICFINDTKQLAIINNNGINLINSSENIIPENSISLENYLKLTDNNSLRIKGNDNTFNTINLNTFLSENNIGNLSFSANQGQSLGLNSIALGAHLSEANISFRVKPKRISNENASMEIQTEVSETDATIASSSEGDAEYNFINTDNNNSIYSKNEFEIISIRNPESIDFSSFIKMKIVVFIFSVLINNENTTVQVFTQIEEGKYNDNDKYIKLIQDIFIPDGYDFNENTEIDIKVYDIVNSVAVAPGSTAIGQGLYNQVNDSMVIGRFNEIKNNIRFAIGSGNGPDNRKNIFEINNDGDFSFYGRNGALMLKTLVNEGNECLSLNIPVIGQYDSVNSTFISLETIIQNKINNELQNVGLGQSEIDNYTLPIIKGPPLNSNGTMKDDAQAVKWINDLISQFGNNKEYLWLDIRLGNGILKRCYEDSRGIKTWNPISSAYT